MTNLDDFIDPTLARFLTTCSKTETFEVEATICFWDITSFSKIFDSININPTYASGIIQDFFSLISESVSKNGGIIHKFMGDGAIALFVNDTTICPKIHSLAESVLHAIKSAIKIQEKFSLVKKTWSDRFFEKNNNISELAIRCGINTGKILTGIIETVVINQFIAIGYNVNLASRLCSNAPDGSILISEAAKQLISKSVATSEYKILSNLKNMHGKFKTWKILGLEVGSAN